MDFLLRCNSLRCRTQLTERAVVTTCSHIFCVPCSESLGLASPSGVKRMCPACETPLPNPDDAVSTQLNPTEDYKTSVLSGLNPSVIMECAARGLAFYTYQTTQEIVYREFLAKSLTDKYNTLSAQMDSIIHDANSEIMGLRDKLQSLQLERESLEKKNHELSNAFKEKSKRQAELNRLYNALKQQQIAGGIQMAADHDAENVIHAAQFNSGARQSRHRTHGSTGSGRSGGAGQPVMKPWEHHQQQFQGSRGSGLDSARNIQPLANNTPSHHRTYLSAPNAMHGMSHASAFHGGGGGTPRRSPLQTLNPNVYGNVTSAGYGGLSAGVKVGRSQSGPMSRNGVRMHGYAGSGGGLEYR